MGMHDELYCEAELPDAVPAGTIFETTTFPHPFLYRYRITKAGRLIDACGRDLRVIYGLASYRIFAVGAPSSFMSNTDEDVETPEELRSIEPKLTLEQKLALSDPGEVIATGPVGKEVP
jgi:hypothetical protein